LQVGGSAHFDTAGKQYIARGKSYVTFNLGFWDDFQTAMRYDILDDTVVFATLRYPHITGLFVEAAVPNAGSDTITIYLNKPAPTTIGVSYFVVNSQGHCDTGWC
jgi:hypothetical protein